MHANVSFLEGIMSKLRKYFSTSEIVLWTSSMVLIAATFLLFDRGNYLTLAASIVGVTSLVFNAKGNPFGQVLMILFSILYGVISYTFSYYGEMITYLGMTMPMAIFALISWIRHPHNGNRAEVEVGTISKKHALFAAVSSVAVTLAFYFILEHFDTANIIPSTLSVTTSYIAAYLTYKRSPYFALAYAANDVVLIVLWVLASISDIRYTSVVVCFAAFLVNDIYGYINWQRMKIRQGKS